MSFDGGAGLRHLHEGDKALLHPRAAGDGHADDRKTVCQRVFKCARDLFTDGGAHAAHHEVRLHQEQGAGMAADASGAADNGLRLFARGSDRLDLLRVVREAERVAGDDVRKQLGKALAVGQVVEPLAGAHAEMVAAGAGIIVAPERADRDVPVAVGAVLFRLAGVRLHGRDGASAGFQLVFRLEEKVQKRHNQPSIMVRS